MGITALDSENDLVLLEVSDSFKAPPLDLSDSGVQIGEPIYVVGNPQGFLEGTVSQGIISGVREFRPGNKRIQMTAPISRGSSGGPVLNDNGTVVGVSVGSQVDGQLLNFAVPSDYLNTLKKICCHVFFYDEEHVPIDSDIVEFSGTIPPNSTKQISGAIDLGIMKQTKHMHVKVVHFKTVD